MTMRGPEHRSDLTKSTEGSQQRPWILRSKLEMPHNNVQLIDRPRLYEQMDQWLSLDLGVVTGPAGYAKSTTIAEWCRQQRNKNTKIAWFSLDEADQEPAQFLSYLVASLASAGIVAPGLETGAEEGFLAGGLSSALSTLLEAVREEASPVVLILDDYHRVGESRVDELLRSLLWLAPSNLTVIIATRVPLPFDIGALLAAGRAREIGSDALAFTKGELATVFPPGLGEDEISLLYERTEGWPVAVQLAKLLIADSPTISHLQNFRGHSGHIATYLAEQIVSGLSKELRAFLCLTSPLERFNVQLADAVTGKTSAGKMIDQLSRLDALVVREEDVDTYYRYHHLFAEFLETELRREYGEEAAIAVHQNASQWYEASGQMAEAVRHAREAGDSDRCASLVEKEGGWELILFGGIGYLRGLLKQIPESVVREYPRTLLAKAYLAMKDGLIADARAMFDAAKNTLNEKVDASVLERDILNIGTLIAGYEDTPTSMAELERLEHQLSQVPVSDPLTRSILASQLIMCELAVGDFVAADHRANMTMRTMREARTVLGLNYCYLHAGLSAMHQGRLKAAEAHFGVARRMAEENFSFDPGLRALSRILTASLQFWMGEQAEYSSEQMEADLDHVEQYDGWLDIYSAGLIVEVFQLGNLEGAITRNDRIAERRGLGRLSRIVDSIKIGFAINDNIGSLALKLKQRLPAEIWKNEPFLWLPFLESRLALGHYYAKLDRSKAIKFLREGLDCAQKFGANVHAVRLLVARAVLLDMAGNRNKAIDDLTEALTIAAGERIVGPFTGHRGLVPLLRAVVRQSQESYIDILIVDFANSIITRLARKDGDAEGGNSAGLSPREREVLDELATGRSNKEIARLLDMTEHTVKFHLKNIFGKLSVDRRTEAVVRAKEMNLI